MAIALPKAIELYFSSENAHDPALLEQCVASDALVRDEHKTIRGLEAIKAWRVETGRKYGHTVQPVAVSERDGAVMTAQAQFGGPGRLSNRGFGGGTGIRNIGGGGRCVIPKGLLARSPVRGVAKGANLGFSTGAHLARAGGGQVVLRGQDGVAQNRPR